jgi:hypothetical protein
MTRRIYRHMLRRLPPDFQRLNGAEMEEAFVESLAITRERWGLFGAPFALIRAAWDLFRLDRELAPPKPARRTSIMSGSLVQDLRIGARRLLRAPAFTAASSSSMRRAGMPGAVRLHRSTSTPGARIARRFRS